MKTSILNSKFFLLGMIILIGLSGTALVREISSTLKIRKEIAKLESQAMQLEAQNKELKALIDYFNSPAYHERAARESLNLQAPGEITVALPETNKTEVTVEENNSQNKVSSRDENNVLRWWNYFFGLETSINE